MAAQVEISTVAAVKAVQVLRQTVVQLDKALRPLGRTVTSLNAKLQKGAGARSFSMEQKRAERTAQRLSKELIRQEKVAASLRRRLLRMRTATKQLGQAQTTTSVKTKGLNTTIRNLGSSAIFAVGPLSGVGARLNAFGAIAGRTKLKVALLAVTVTALAVAAVKLVSAMVKTGLEMFRIRSSLKAASGSAVEAARQFKFVAETAARLGVDLKATGLQFAQLAAAAKGTRLEGRETQRVFEAISTAAVVLGLDASQTQGALRAVQQMMSKSTVQAEELRGQLGERLPGAFGLAAKAMGVTTKELGKMLEQGEVLAEDMLPRLATELMRTFGPQVEMATAGLASRLGALSTEVTLLLDAMEQRLSIMQKFAGAIDSIVEAIRRLRKEVAPTIKEVQAELAKMLAKIEKDFEMFASGRSFLDRFTDFLRRGPTAKEPIVELSDDIAQVNRLIARLQDLGIEVAAVRRHAAGIAPVMGGLGAAIPAARATPGLVATGGRTGDIAPVIGGVGMPRALPTGFIEALAEMRKAVEPMEALAKAASMTADSVRIQKELTKRLTKLGFDEVTAKGRVAELLRDIIEREFTAERTVKERLKAQKDLVKAEEKAFAVVVKAAAQQDKDRLAAFKRSDIIIASADKIKAAFESQIVIAERALRIEEDSSLTTEEKITLIAQLTLFERELFRQRKAGVPLTSPKELADLRAATDSIVEMKEKLSDLKEETREAKRSAMDFSRVIGSAFEDAIIKGDGFRSVLKGIIDDINKIILRTTVTKRFENFLTERLSSGGGILDLFSGNAAGPGPGAGPPLRFAHGGRPPAKKISIVGEKGPELFKPDVPGTIVPLRPGGGRGAELERFSKAQAVDVTAKSLEADMLGGFLSLFGGPVAGMMMGGVRRGMFGRFGVVGGSLAPQVGSREFADVVSAGRRASELGAGSTFGGGFGQPGRGPDIRGDGGFGGGGGGGGRAGSAGTSSPGGIGGFAHGGRPPVGRTALVGEAGPEFFVPDRSRATSSGAAASIIVNQRFDFRGASLEAVALLRRESARIRKETIAEVGRQRIRGIRG